eukprot:Plantae.Rhodophyta-Purpureofilum_apyrenoidigerum.ctg6768.p1 GENE.Plantae.Rhodophyta-Purpureofilum_apyrenoidigerum.ctg6768~~Plantae.Rhodophyta-Purpureofilum_apyrenoidigerum.ctg6768.p1  ORF type:complete len:380 (+),score=72.74 Plantae.Rhodophyta-Purpureofilum_apyrenoidigerum.ctg6768:75-1142(+)
MAKSKGEEKDLQLEAQKTDLKDAQRELHELKNGVTTLHDTVDKFSKETQLSRSSTITQQSSEDRRDEYEDSDKHFAPSEISSSDDTSLMHRLKQQFLDVKHMADSLTMEAEDLRSESAQQQVKIRELEGRLSDLRGTYDEIMREVHALREQLIEKDSELEQSREATQLERQRAEKSIYDGEANVAALKSSHKEIEDLSQQLNEWRFQENRWRTALSDLRQKIEAHLSAASTSNTSRVQDLAATEEKALSQQSADARHIFSLFNQLLHSMSELQIETHRIHSRLDEHGVKSDCSLSARVSVALNEWRVEVERFERLSRSGDIRRCDAERQHMLEDKIERLTEELFHLREHLLGHVC